MEGFSLAKADCEYRAPLSPRLARPGLMLVEEGIGVNDRNVMSLATQLQYAEEGLLRDLDAADPLHALFALGLPLHRSLRLRVTSPP